MSYTTLFKPLVSVGCYQELQLSKDLLFMLYTRVFGRGASKLSQAATLSVCDWLFKRGLEWALLLLKAHKRGRYIFRPDYYLFYFPFWCIVFFSTLFLVKNTKMFGIAFPIVFFGLPYKVRQISVPISTTLIFLYDCLRALSLNIL